MTLTPTKSMTPTPTASGGLTPTPTPTLTQTPNPIADCDNIYYFQDSGSSKKFEFKIEVGTGTGQYGILYDVIDYAKRFVIEYDGVEVADSLWVGADSTLSAGLSVFSEYTQYSINNNTVTYDNTVSDVESLIIDTTADTDFGFNTGTLTFMKNTALPSEIVVYIYTNNKFPNIEFTIDPICNDLPPTPSETPAMTVTPTMTITQTPSATLPPAPPIPCDSNEITFNFTGKGIFEINSDLGENTETVDIT